MSQTLDERTKLIHNERTKLLANALDRASTALLVAGIVTPAAGYFYRLTGATTLASGLLVTSFYVWFFCGVGLHLGGRRVLGRLR